MPKLIFLSIFLFLCFLPQVLATPTDKINTYSNATVCVYSNRVETFPTTTQTIYKDTTLSFSVYIFVDSCDTTAVNDANVTGWLKQPNGTINYLNYTFIGGGLYTSTNYTFSEIGNYNATTSIRSATVGNITSTSLITVIAQTVVGGGGAGIPFIAVQYEVQCDPTVCYNCQLKCDLFIKNNQNLDVNVTGRYWVVGETNPVTKTYMLKASSTNFFAEYIPVSSQVVSFSDLNNKQNTTNSTRTVEFQFNPPYTELRQNFRVVSWAEKNLFYLVIIGVIIISTLLILKVENERLKKIVRRLRNRV